MGFIAEIEALDKSLTLAINSLNCPASDWVWMLFSNKEIWIILYAAVIYLFFRKLGWKRSLVAIATCVLMVVCCDQGANLVKDAVSRVRPCNDADMLARGLHVLEQGGGWSFFSAHAANSVGFAASSLACFRWDGKSHKAYAIGIYSWALMVSVSRIFVARHFLGDVLTGIVVGLVVGILIPRLSGLVCRKAINQRG